MFGFQSPPPEVVVQAKPFSYCSSLAVEGGRALAAVGGRDGIIHLWSLNSHREVRRLEGHTDAITSLTFSSNDRYLLSGSADGTARLWDPVTGVEVRHFDTARVELVPAKMGADGRIVPSAVRRVPVQVTEVGFIGSDGVVTSDTSGTIRRWREDGRLVWAKTPVRRSTWPGGSKRPRPRAGA